MGSITKMAEITSATTAESTDSESTDSDDDGASIPDVYEEIGANMERVREAYEVYDEDSLEGMEGLAELLAGDDAQEVIEAAEDYRHSNGINRIRSNWGYARGGDFLNEWFRNFYGPSDGSEDGTHNFIQQRARDAGVNLPWYKIMFPTPHPDYGEDSVQVTEWDDIVLPKVAMRDDEDRQDANIFVPAWYAERFAGHVNDEGIPLPPAEAPDGEYGGSDEDSSAPEVEAGDVDPADYTVDELRDLVEEIDDVEKLADLLALERQGKSRKTGRLAIKGRLSEVAGV